MSQMSWTYIADDGARYDVGLFHGDRTGHLLVYCNARIVVIDFSVLASKNYSFFINDELCDLVIEEKDGKFLYGFQVDEGTATARNRGRRKMLRTEVRQSLLIGFLFILIILMIGWLVFRFNS